MPIPIVFPDPQVYRRELEEKVRVYEERYEMSSEEMLDALTDGSERETNEKLRWMSDYHVLRYLNAQTPTTGTPGTTTEASMRSALLRTGS